MNVGVSNAFFLAPTTAFIFTQSELEGMIAPIIGPLEISTIWLRHGGGPPISSVTLSNFTIRMGHTSWVDALPNFSDNFNIGSPQIVLSQSTYTYSPIVSNADDAADGWTPIELETPFTYNFSDNLCIEFSFDAFEGTVAGNYASIDSWSATGTPVAQHSFEVGETEASFAGPRPMLGLGSACQTETIVNSVTSCGDFINEMGELYTTSGQYVYNLVSETGCEIIVDLELLIVTPPNVTINTSTTGCNTQTEFFTLADGFGPFTFEIPELGLSNTTGNFTLNSGIYELIITDAAGCQTETVIDNSAAIDCPADFDQNLSIGVGDLQLFISAYGCNGDCCPFDLNNNLAVSVSDLLIFIAAFGEICD